MSFSLTLLLVACSPESGMGAPPETERAASCDDSAAALDVTWEAWADGFHRTSCQGCHASDAPNRYGAPVAVVFDTEADAVASCERTRARVLDAGTMPPAGGVPASDRVLLEAWLDCVCP